VGRLEQGLARPTVWQGLMWVIAVIWFVVVVSHRIHVWLRASNRDRGIGREMRQNIQRIHATRS
jgi:hypothetical protein